MIRALRYGWIAPVPTPDGHKPPERNPKALPSARLQLGTVAWGKRDPALARAVCEHIADAMPPVVIRFNPITHRRVCAFLRSYGIAH